MDIYSIGTSLYFGQPLFTKFWNINLIQNYYKSLVPGYKKGISASCVGGNNLVINDNISEEKKIAAGKQLSFFYQKNSKKYNVRFGERKNLNQFLYGGLSAKKALRNINYINSFDQILYNSLDGYIVEGISVLIITIIVLSYGLVFTNKFQFLTNTISKTLLSFQILGLCMTGSYVFFILGKLSKFKCLAGMVFFFMGISFIITPLLIMEIIYFPENNKLSEFAKKHSCILLFLILLIDFVVYGIALILQPVHIEKFRSSENMIFRSCIHNKGYYFIFYIMVFLFKGILLLLILILAFIEWNLLDIKREIKIVSYIWINN
ncbi:hypothetical protein LY90DRAFT_499672 [Neocallimastix californiae]|uniref:G-protein coupled receptors family 3 profile domain-containing protein n=1 Tax=Neocallimastix californiae TaxID=1754190 RepID=A0A1Y2FJQ2_9FUNG|nr:hypothetical protein LY90DRAFT_499672 [Neocallimastix californiae]|eukprot:ORY83466.1 hypothetical protein LY90DRAFT_499672 [Neocallimastix californiae]